MNREFSTVSKTSAKPYWLKVKAPLSHGYNQTFEIVRNLKLNTVCEEAACPNVGECWKRKHATIMILGSVCTRACKFCNIPTGRPDSLDPHEPERVAKAVYELSLKHVVITSVSRDDLDDGGARHFAKCIEEIRKLNNKVTIEVLTPDFLRKKNAVEILVSAKPDVFNHNIETVPSLYRDIIPGALYFHSINLLNKVKSLDDSIFTKSGLMVGLGEKKDEVLQVMDDMRAANIDFLNIGQYLQPTLKHAEVKEYVTPEMFNYYAKLALSKGFSIVSASPLTRSSYHADEDFERLKKLTRNLV